MHCTCVGQLSANGKLSTSEYKKEQTLKIKTSHPKKEWVSLPPKR